MKKSLLALTLLAAAPAFAVSPPSVLHSPVAVDAMGFTAKIDDGRVLAHWKRYKRGDLYGYMILRSDKDDPQYAPKKAVWEAYDAATVNYEEGIFTPGTRYYRLAIVTTFGDIWLSPTVKLDVKPEDVRRSPPTVADFE